MFNSRLVNILRGLGFSRIEWMFWAATLLGVILLIVDKYAARWIWWNWPEMRLMHMTLCDGDGKYRIYDRDCYTSKIYPMALAITAMGSVGACAGWIERKSNPVKPHRIPWGYISLILGILALLFHIVILSCVYMRDIPGDYSTMLKLSISLLPVIIFICPSGIACGIVSHSAMGIKKLCEDWAGRAALMGVIVNTAIFFYSFTYIHFVILGWPWPGCE